MTRRLALTAGQITALCKGATKAGFIPEIVMGDVVIRLVPDNPVSASTPRKYDPENPETFETLDQYLAWRERVAKAEVASENS